MAYDGFISYSHAADGELAPALQNALQRMAKPWYRRRALDVFRDETGLSVDPHLWGAIVTALEDAEWFVLLTSPQAAGSEWVNREIEHWKATRPVDRILPVVTEGHWQWDEAAGDFTADSTAVPPALRGVFTDEPRHLDLRWARDEGQLDLRHGKFRDSVAEIAAPLHGRSKDDLEGEDVRQHRRTLRLAWGAAVALVFLTMAAVMGAGIAVRNADQAEARRVEADAQRLVAQSQTVLDQPDLAFLLAAEADRLRPTNATRSALLTALATRPEFRQRIDVGESVTSVDYSADDDLVAIGTIDGSVLLHRFSDGEAITVRRGLFPGEVADVLITKVDRRVEVVAADNIDVPTLLTIGISGETILEREVPSAVFGIDAEKDSGRVLVVDGSSTAMIWDHGEDEPSITFDADPTNANVPFVAIAAWTPDGNVLTGDIDGTIRLWNPNRPARPVWSVEAETNRSAVTAIATLGTDRLVAGNRLGDVRFLNLDDGSATDAVTPPTGDGGVTDIAVTGSPPDEGSIAVTRDNGHLVYLNDRTGFPTFDIAPPRVHNGRAASVAWDPSEPFQGVTGGGDDSVLLLQYGSEEQRLPLGEIYSNSTATSMVALSPDGSRLAVGRAEDLVLADPRQPKISGPTLPIDAIALQMGFTPDGRHLVAGLADGSLLVWDGSAAEAAVTVGADTAIQQLAISDDGTTVASVAQPAVDATESVLKLWTLESGTLRLEDEVAVAPAAYGIQFVDGDRRVVTGGLGVVSVHVRASGETERIDVGGVDVGGLANVLGIAVQPQTELIAVSLRDGTIRFVDAVDMEEVGDAAQVAGGAYALAFTGDGAALATVSETGTFRLTDVETREPMAPGITAHLPPPGSSANASLATVGDLVVSASIAGGRVVRWPLDTASWVAAGCELHGRALTEGERSRFEIDGSGRTCAD